jgi:hypothetical protein
VHAQPKARVVGGQEAVPDLVYLVVGFGLMSSVLLAGAALALEATRATRTWVAKR